MDASSDSASQPIDQMIASRKLGSRPRAKKCKSRARNTNRATSSPENSAMSAPVMTKTLEGSDALSGSDSRGQTLRVRGMLGHVALGSWSGGRFMRFGEPIAEERLEALLRPGGGIRSIITADAYGAGEADALVGRALEGVPRGDYALAGAVGHDFYEGEREGAKGYPRFTDPSLLLPHNPDRRGFESPEVWTALRDLRDQGLTRAIGVAPGPANGFTLDLIGCFERYGELIDWAMIILNPLEPWPGEMVLDAAARFEVSIVTRVVDYGGLFPHDLLPRHAFPRGDHRGFRPEGWVEAGREKLEQLRPIAARHGLTMLQLACAWNLSHAAVECVAPTLIEEPGGAKPIERKREELAQVPELSPLTVEEVVEIRAIGDNTGSMLLKGATPDHA